MGSRNTGKRCFLAGQVHWFGDRRAQFIALPFTCEEVTVLVDPEDCPAGSDASIRLVPTTGSEHTVHGAAFGDRQLGLDAPFTGYGPAYTLGVITPDGGVTRLGFAQSAVLTGPVRNLKVFNTSDAAQGAVSLLIVGKEATGNVVPVSLCAAFTPVYDDPE